MAFKGRRLQRLRSKYKHLSGEWSFRLFLRYGLFVTKSRGRTDFYTSKARLVDIISSNKVSFKGLSHGNCIQWAQCSTSATVSAAHRINESFTNSFRLPSVEISRITSIMLLGRYFTKSAVDTVFIRYHLLHGFKSIDMSLRVFPSCLNSRAPVGQTLAQIPQISQSSTIISKKSMPCNPLTIAPTDPTERLPLEHSCTQIPQQCIFRAYRSAVYLFFRKKQTIVYILSFCLPLNAILWMLCTATHYHSEWIFHSNFHSNVSAFSSEHGLRCPQAFRNTLYLLRQKDLK